MSALFFSPYAVNGLEYVEPKYLEKSSVTPTSHLENYPKYMSEGGKKTVLRRKDSALGRHLSEDKYITGIVSLFKWTK